jgi:hypothetical protein
MAASSMAMHQLSMNGASLEVETRRSYDVHVVAQSW